MKPLFIACSDAHLRARRGDEQFAFEQVVDEAVSRKLDVLAGGDMLDKQSNRAEVVTFLYRQLDRLQKVGKKVYYTQGQHDYDDPPWFSGHPAAVHLHGKMITFGDVTVYGLDWQPFGKLQEELGQIPSEADFLLCHQVWSDWMGEITAPQGSFAEIPGHVKYVQTGDLHEWRLERRKNADGEKMLVCSCGATTQLTVGEPAKHYFALFYPDGRFDPKQLKSRVMIDWDVMNRPEDVQKFLEEIEESLAVASQKAAAMDLPDALAKPYLRVTYSPSLPDAVRRVEKAVGDRVILFPKQLVPAEKTAAYKQAEKAAKGVAVTPLSMLGREVDKAENPDAYELCERMLLAQDRPMEFAKWRAEQLGEGPKSETEEES